MAATRCPPSLLLWLSLGLLVPSGSTTARESELTETASIRADPEARVWRRLKDQKDLKDKKHSLSRRRRQSSKPKEQALPLASTLERLQHDKEALNQKVVVANQQLVEKAAKLSEMAAHLSASEAKIAQLNAKTAEGRSADTLAAELKDQAAKAAQLSASSSAQQKEIAELTEELAALRIENEHLRHRYEDPSLQMFLSAKATKVYQDPGIEGAANKTFKYVLPKVKEALQKSSEVYMSLNTTVHESLLSLMEDTAIEPWVPAVSGFLVYGIICLPLGVSLSCLAEFICKVQEILLACAFYLFSINALAAGFILWSGKDPLLELAEQDSSVYLLQQVGFAVVLILYSGLLVLVACFWEAADDKSHSWTLGRYSQLVAVGCFCIFYYKLVWTPAMLDELPLVDTFMSQWGAPASLSYLLAALLFGGVLLIENFLRSRADKEEHKDA